MRFLSLSFFFLSFYFSSAQPSLEEERLTNNLTYTSDLPKGLLAGRSIVLYEGSVTVADLTEAQKYFQKAGIDVISYLDVDYVLAGTDPSVVFSNYFNSRGVKFLILFQKSNNEYQSVFTEYNGKKTFGDKDHMSWKQSNTSFVELLRTIYRFAISTQKKENFLINDVPETGFAFRVFKEQNTNFSGDVRFKVAIPRWENEADEKELEAFLKDNFPVKWDPVDPNLTDAELDDKGYRMVLRFVHTRGDVARDILGYDVTQTASSLSSIYYEEKVLKIKTIPSKKMIYKFYFKNTAYGNIFVGSKWDADETWQEALRNHILAMRAELKF